MGRAPARTVVFTPYAEEIIKHKARQLARRTDLCRSDEHDFAQEMRRYLLSRFHHFDPQRSCYSTFVARVINSWIASLLREQRRQKRAAGRKTVSLDAPRGSGEGADTAMRDALSTENIPGRSDALPDDVISRQELMTAVARVVDALAMLQEEVWEITQQYLEARRRGKWLLNTSNCFAYERPCEYLPYCQSNFNPNVRDNLFQIAPPHEELAVSAASDAETTF